MPRVSEYIEDKVVVDGVSAIRRRKNSPARKLKEPYLHIPMKCLEALCAAKLTAHAFSLALWIIWHYTVTRGSPTIISAKFASRAGINDRAARRYAIAALEGSGLFDVQRKGTEATKLNPADSLKAILSGGPQKAIARVGNCARVSDSHSEVNISNKSEHG